MDGAIASGSGTFFAGGSTFALGTPDAVTSRAGYDQYAVGNNFIWVRNTVTSRTPVTFSAATDGSAGAVTSTVITLTFSTAVTGLTAGNITIADGSAGKAVKGVLSGSGAVWTIDLTNVIAEGDVAVSVSDFGLFDVDNTPQTVQVYKHIVLTYTIMATPSKPFVGDFYPDYTSTFTPTVTVTNTGTGTVTLVQPASPSGFYIIDALSTATLAPNASATFTVQGVLGLPSG